MPRTLGYRLERSDCAWNGPLTPQRPRIVVRRSRTNRIVVGQPRRAPSAPEHPTERQHPSHCPPRPPKGPRRL
ncbi:hypothetical protein PGTUg99_035791 [Puccinia graminis f. sp. tritici]|uniref:Uncharacterized protein n=1 Tax=Puccinia graminis f. sp. tritici TaxID=56615 RepID=A0A5B0RYS1_PUCGR|nr:hypothetical protein PGTUg99_035791 [Puccinia graminis f. sp. tritici]